MCVCLDGVCENEITVLRLPGDEEEEEEEEKSIRFSCMDRRACLICLHDARQVLQERR